MPRDGERKTVTVLWVKPYSFLPLTPAVPYGSRRSFADVEGICLPKIGSQDSRRPGTSLNNLGGEYDLQILAPPIAGRISCDPVKTRAGQKLPSRHGANFVIPAATITVSPVVGSETRETMEKSSVKSRSGVRQSSPSNRSGRGFAHRGCW